MATLTFEALHAEVRAHHAAEAANRTPYAQALGALTTLREALSEMAPSDRNEIRDEMDALIAEQHAAAWAGMGDVLEG